MAEGNRNSLLFRGRSIPGARAIQAERKIEIADEMGDRRRSNGKEVVCCADIGEDERQVAIHEWLELGVPGIALLSLILIMRADSGALQPFTNP